MDKKDFAAGLPFIIIQDIPLCDTPKGVTGVLTRIDSPGVWGRLDRDDLKYKDLWLYFYQIEPLIPSDSRYDVVYQ